MYFGALANIFPHCPGPQSASSYFVGCFAKDARNHDCALAGLVCKYLTAAHAMIALALRPVAEFSLTDMPDARSSNISVQENMCSIGNFPAVTTAVVMFPIAHRWRDK